MSSSRVYRCSHFHQHSHRGPARAQYAPYRRGSCLRKSIVINTDASANLTHQDLNRTKAANTTNNYITFFISFYTFLSFADVNRYCTIIAHLYLYGARVWVSTFGVSIDFRPLVTENKVAGHLAGIPKTCFSSSRTFQKPSRIRPFPKLCILRI